MIFEEIVQKFINNTCYLTNGAGMLSNKWNVPIDTIKAAKAEARSKLKDTNLKTEEVKENITEGKLTKKWFNGKTWCESRSFEGVDGLDIEEILNKIDFNIKPVETPKISSENEFNLNVLLSDQHIGAKVENGLYTNYFDDEIYWDRMDQVFMWIVKKVTQLGIFKSINIFYLGDTFDGQDGFTVKRTHALPQNMSNNEAFEVGLDVNLKFIDKLVVNDLAENISVYCVQDSNHGGSMDYYLFKSLQKVLKYKHPEVYFHIADKFIDFVNIGNRTFLYTHGKDGKDMKFGLPLDLNDKTENFINQFLDNYEINNKDITLYKGDLHQNAVSTAKRFVYRNVPSLFGSSGWIMKNYGNTKPGVGYDMFDDNDIFGGVIKFKT